MSQSAVKLASGYIELTVKKAGNAMKEITAEITDLEKAAKRSGEAAGEALNKGISDGLKKKSSGRTGSLAEEIVFGGNGGGSSTSSQTVNKATKVGADTGKAVSDALNKGVEKGAQDAGKTIQDEITKGATKGAQDAGKAVGDELSKAGEKAGEDAGKRTGRAMRDSLSRVGKEIGKDIIQAIPADVVGDGLGNIVEGGLKKVIGGSGWGKALSGALGNVASAAADAWIEGIQKRLSDTSDAVEKMKNSFVGLGNAGSGSPLGGWLHEIAEQAKPVVEQFTGIRDVMAGIKNNDVARTFTGMAKALQELGFSGAADTMQTIGKEADNAQQKFNSLRGNIKDTADGLLTIVGEKTRISGALAAIGESAGWIAAAVLSAKELVNQLDNIPLIHNRFYNPDGTYKNPIDRAVSQIPVLNWFDPPRPAPLPVMTPQEKDAAGKLIIPPQFRLPGNAGGGIAGVTPAGRIYGPGTGTSDSILGVDASGVPVARVSDGEGIVKKAAMDRGAAPIVDALNRGWMLPGFDEGGVIGGAAVPDPMMMRWFNAVQQGRIRPDGTLPPGVGAEGGLQSNTIVGKRIISALFPEITDIGGFRQDSLKWHPSGLALDVMIPGQGGLNDPTTPAGKALGDQINAFVRQNAAALGSDYTLWQVPDHHNHIHVNFAPSGYPGKDQKFVLPPAFQAMVAAAQTQAGAGGGVAPLVGLGQSPDMGAPVGVGGQDDAGAGLPGGPDRTQGYIPAGAGGSGQAGSSLFSGALQMGAQAINGLIDQAASAAATAASAAITAGSFGAGAGGGSQAGAAATQFAIGLATQAAKRGVSYGFQMAGIGADALSEILLPFGVPRYFQTDPTQFIPQLPGQAAAVTTGEKAEQQQEAGGQAAPGRQPGGPVQPGQLPGEQPVGPPVQFAKPQGVPSAPAPIGSAIGGGPEQPAIPAPTPPGPVVPVPGMEQTTQGVAGLPAPPAAPAAPAAPNPPPATGGSPYVKSLPDYLRSLSAGVFDDGGWLMPGDLGINLTDRPEPILNSDQWSDLQAIANSEVSAPDPKAVGGLNDYSVRIDHVTVTDVNELQREIDARQRLQIMRHAGRP